MILKAVIGLGFGDCGKGMFTNYLCHQSSNNLVVRFSGGHQAGHTVDHYGTKHVFSTFGAGTLAGVPTYWSKFCTVSPMTIMNEYKALREKYKGYIKLYIDENCPVTTPYEILKNRANTSNHGTCGVGVGATFEREQNLYSLKAIDLFYPKILKAKLDKFANYYGFTPELDYFLSTCEEVIANIDIDLCNGMPQGFSNIICEGSQGLMLDQHFGIYPNVTWSDVGLKNIDALFNNHNPELFLITRAYQTRHGNGFMTNEDIPHNIKLDPNETNVDNEFQGKFRRSLLDVSLLEYAIRSDERIRENTNKNLVITCLDHIENEYRFTYNDEIVCCENEEEFLDKISEILGIYDLYLSRSSDSSQVDFRNQLYARNN